MAIVNPGRSYTAPPIIEAVIDIQFFEPLSEAKMRKVVGKLRREYPHEQAQQDLLAQFDISTQETKVHSTPVVRLTSPDQADLVIVGPAKFTSARLAPYVNYMHFASRFLRDYEVINEAVGLRKIARIGLRYINRIDVPEREGVVHYEEYLAINLPLPEFLDPVNSYGWRVEKLFKEESLIAIVQSATVAPEVPGTGAFILDIDIIAKDNLPFKINDLVAKLEKMRAMKNAIFELSIHERARESFGK